MHRDHATDPAVGQDRPGPTRRTLVRSAAHAAWAAPLVQAVGSAPAYAASHSLSVPTATFWWKDWRPTFEEEGVVPRVTVRNDGPQTMNDLTIQLRFSPGFAGAYPEWPSLVNDPGTGWITSNIEPEAPGTVLTYVRTGPQLGPGQEATLGRWQYRANPYSIGWPARSSDPITVLVTATGYADVTSVLTEVPRP